MSFKKHPPATLALADGTIFRGQSFGAPVTITGEIVFNTSMTGYQEILTDPSYYGQIITMTCPHIGNVGVNPEDEEARRPWATRFWAWPAAAQPISSNLGIAGATSR